MNSWLRWHVDPTVGRISCATFWDGQEYLATVVEPEGESRVPTIVTISDDVERAKLRADELLLSAYPHACDAQHCEAWERL